MQLKDNKTMRTEQKILDNKPVFVKLAGATVRKPKEMNLSATKNPPQFVHLKTFNMPVRPSERKLKRPKIAYLATTRRGKSSGRIVPLQGIKT